MLPMRIECCGCGEFMGVKDSIHGGVSHGICQDCVIRLYPEIFVRGAKTTIPHRGHTPEVIPVASGDIKN